MSRVVQRCLTALLVLFVVGGISFGASQAFGSTRVSDDYYCGEYDEELGCCPLYDDTTCMEDCWDLGYHFGGGCLSHEKDKNGCTSCCSCLW